MILSYGLWQRRYGGDKQIVNKDIILNGEKHTVVGVMPANFRFLTNLIGLWVPASFRPEELTQRDGQTVRLSKSQGLQ